MVQALIQLLQTKSLSNITISELTERGYRGRKVGLVENGSWAPMAAKVMRGMLEGCKDITFTDTTVRILSALSEESRAAIDAMADELMQG